MNKKISSSEGQKLLDEYVQKTLYENNKLQKDSINGMMLTTEISSSSQEKSITFGFPVQKWQANRVGNLHGGIICTAFDITIAAVARFFAEEDFAPTIGLDVRFIRPIKMDDMLIIKANAIAVGRRISHLEAKAISKESGKIIASATSTYMNINTAKENQKK